MAAIAIAWLPVFIGLAVATEASSKINCNDGKFYIRADPDSCSHFYKCDNGRPVRFTCGDGLYFNPSIYVCDWPYNVKCDVNSKNKQASSTSKGGSNQAGQNSDYNNQAGQNSEYNNQAGQNSGYNNQAGQYSEYGNQAGQNGGYNNQSGQNSGYNNQAGQYNNGNEVQYSGNSKQTGEYNSYNNQGGQSKGKNNQEGSGQTPYYVVKDVPSEGPSIRDPSGPLEQPRLTVDNDQSAKKNYYTIWQEDDIDIR